MQLSSPQLWIKSRRAPEPEGFVEHSSKVGETAEKPFLVIWRHGHVQAVYMDAAESVSSANLKRGLASLFQYRTLDDEHIHQRDASGLCNVTYVSLGPQSIQKQKTDCVQSSLPRRKLHPNPVFDVSLASTRNATYTLTHSLLPERVVEHEAHRMTLTSKSDVGTTVLSERTLEQLPQPLSVNPVQADTVKHAIALLQPGYRETDIDLQLEPAACPDAGCPTVNSCNVLTSCFVPYQMTYGSSTSIFSDSVALI